MLNCRTVGGHKWLGVKLVTTTDWQGPPINELLFH